MRTLILALIVTVTLAACGGISPTGTACAGPACATPVYSGSLHPYQTDTVTPSITPPLIKSPTPTPTATVTPTPITYKVRDKDDMYGIAFAFGISPQALMTANPSVNPRAMGPGTVLIIPVTRTPDTAHTPTTPLATPTALVSVPRPPDCYLAIDGGAWCFLLVANDHPASLENATGVIRLSAAGLETPLEQAAATLLDLLPGNSAAPLVAYFPPPVPASFTGEGEVTLALPLPAGDERYLAISIQDQKVTINGDGNSAQTTGHLALAAGGKPASQVWIAATAFSADGAVVGVRKWEGAATPYAPGSTIPFDLQVYTLGPPIDHITLLVQARP